MQLQRRRTGVVIVHIDVKVRFTPLISEAVSHREIEITVSGDTHILAPVATADGSRRGVAVPILHAAQTILDVCRA